MKILSDKDKKIKKKEYKYRHTKVLVPQNVKYEKIKDKDKNFNKYLYHYSRLLYKRNFLQKQILNLDPYVREVFFNNIENISLMIETFKFTDAEKFLQNIFLLDGLIDNEKINIETKKFYRSVLLLSTLISKLSNILDEIDPKNKNKFKYGKVKDFFYGIKEVFEMVKCVAMETKNR